MPKKIKIVNGPGHSTLMFNGPMFRCFFDCSFTIKGEDDKPVFYPKYPEDTENPYRLRGSVIGVIYNGLEDKKEIDEQTSSPGRLSLIFRHRTINDDYHYFVFRYDLKTHAGEGWYFTEKEFFTDDGLMGSSSGGKHLVNTVTRTLLTPLNIGVGQPKE